MARTTNIDLRGDRHQAEKLALAHVDRLLYNFREFNGFQNLQINSRLTNFFDESGAYIGKIYMQTVHGTETVIVDVPPKVYAEEERKLSRKYTIRIERVLPAILTYNASGDFIGFTVCTSGTFEPPYEFYENESDYVRSGDFTDRESTVGIDPDEKVKLSEDIAKNVTIYLVPHTGEYPLVSGDFDYLVGDMPQPFMYWTIAAGPTRVTCDVGCYRYFDLTANNGAPYREWTAELWGQPIAVGASTQNYTVSGGYKGDDMGLWFCGNAATVMAMAESFSRDPDGYIEARPAGFAQNLTQTWVDHTIDFPGYLSGVTAERDDLTHFASLYTMEDTISVQYEHSEVDFCNPPVGINTYTETKDTFSLYLNVDASEHLIGFSDTGEDNVWYQFEGGLRYYGATSQDNVHSSKALCADVKWHYNSSNTTFTYHHYSSKRGTVISTPFEDPTGAWIHEITGVEVDGAPVYGSGEVLMVRRVVGDETVEEEIF